MEVDKPSSQEFEQLAILRGIVEESRRDRGCLRCWSIYTAPAPDMNHMNLMNQKNHMNHMNHMKQMHHMSHKNFMNHRIYMNLSTL